MGGDRPACLCASSPPPAFPLLLWARTDLFIYFLFFIFFLSLLHCCFGPGPGMILPAPAALGQGCSPLAPHCFGLGPLLPIFCFGLGLIFPSPPYCFGPGLILSSPHQVHCHCCLRQWGDEASSAGLAPCSIVTVMVAQLPPPV